MTTVERENKAVILVVDDNPVNLDVLSAYLSDSGYTLLLKKDGEKAISLLDRKQPDIILLDIVMPGIDGLETCRRLKADERTRDIPVIFMTALSDPVDKIKGFEAGAVDYITKPFHQGEVLARVRAHLMIRTLQRDLEVKNRELENVLERERKWMEDLRLNLSISLPHELRTPLISILGFSEFLKDGQKIPAPEKVTEYGDRIHESAVRLHRLVENSLLYANLKLVRHASGEKLSRKQKNLVETRGFIEAIALKKAREKGREEDMSLALSDARIRISTENFSKIVTELLDNAFKFSRPGKTVQVQSITDGSLFILRISDQGSGMRPDQIDNIGAFMQFDRRIQEQQGTGLGLVISWLLTRLEDGIMNIESRAGRGTSIRLVFNGEEPGNIEEKPLWFEGAGENQDQWAETELARISSSTISVGEKAGWFRVAVVHDNEKNMGMMTSLLEPLGFEIREFPPGHGRWEELTACAPHMVFIDHTILMADSYEFMLRTRNVSGQLHVIGISDNQKGTGECFQDLCDDILPLPLRSEAILEKLATYLGLDFRPDQEPDLELKTEKDEGNFLFFPPMEELETLRNYAVGGQITKIHECLQKIEQKDPAYLGFVKKNMAYARNFQTNLIRDFVEKCMKESEGEVR